MVIARSVGTFARALDCTSTVRQPSLHMSAAAASRDITLLHAMDVLHKHNYDVSKAISSLVPSGGPVLCRQVSMILIVNVLSSLVFTLASL